MGFPTLDFNGTEGQKSTGLSGPDALEADLRDIARMFDPGSTLKSGEPGGITAVNIRPAAITGDLPDTVALMAAPWGLAALILAESNPAVAAFYQQRYEEAKRRIPANKDAPGAQPIATNVMARQTKEPHLSASYTRLGYWQTYTSGTNFIFKKKFQTDIP